MTKEGHGRVSGTHTFGIVVLRPGNFSHGAISATLIVQGIFAKIGPDLELRGGDLISSPVDSIVSLVSPKKSYGPNSVGKNYFSATPFSLLAKNATGGHNA